MSLLKSKHAFGASEGLAQAISDGKIDAYDILFLDGDTDNPKIGWLDKSGEIVIVNDNVGEDDVVAVDALPETGETGKIYVFESKGWIWDGEKFVDLCTPTDVSALTDEMAAIKKSVERLDNIQADIEYVVSSKPEGTVVDYRDKEIRIMCPVDTEWSLQQSGENADANMYYIGVKAYAPNDDVVSFKEDLAQTISDETMYYFEDNEFAGVDADGRKYSIVWLPAAAYDATSDTWTYYGAGSADGKFVGWYYSVEWYNAEGVVIASDCIRINLSNEECHADIKPYYADDIVTEAVSEAKLYTDEQIAAKIAEALANVTGVPIVEF